MQEVTREVVQQRMESIEFMRRTGIRADEVSYGFGRAVLPLKGNDNHFKSMYMGAYGVLAEAGAATCVSTLFDFEKHFPVVRSIQMDFLRPAYTDLSSEYRLQQSEIDRILKELEEGAQRVCGGYRTDRYRGYGLCDSQRHHHLAHLAR